MPTLNIKQKKANMSVKNWSYSYISWYANDICVFKYER